MALNNIGKTKVIEERLFLSGSIYGLIDVRDVDPNYDSGTINSFDSRDHVRLEWVNDQGDIKRVALVPQQGGFVAIFRVSAKLAA